MIEIKNLNDLRASLANELNRISRGDTTPAAANAFSNLAGKMLNSVKLELEYNRMIGITPNIPFIKDISTQPNAPSLGAPEVKNAENIL